MPTKTIQGATIQDVEMGLLSEYGRNNVKQRTKTNSTTTYSFQINSKSHGNCVATKNKDGVTITMSPRTHTFLWIATIIGYLACIVPGIAITIWIIIVRAATAVIINSRFPKMVEAVQQAKDKNTTTPPPLPPNKK